nr:substrate-binding domain-containing protein [Kocuria sp. JC486]
MAEVLKDKPVDGQSCIQLEIVAESSSQTATRAAAGELGDQVWIPDSSARLPASAIDSEVVIHTPSLASSPAVVVGRDQVDAPDSWTEVFEDDSIRMSDPAVDAGAFAALQGVAHDVDSGVVSEQSALRAMTPRAHTQGVDSPVLLAPELLADVRDNGSRAVVSERAFLTSRAQAGGDRLTAVTPPSGTAFLDFPLVIPRESSDAKEFLPEAADEIRGWLESNDGRRVLSAANYRTPQGETTDRHAATVPARFQKPEPETWESIAETYRTSATPMNVLVVMDASASMRTESSNGRSRWDDAVRDVELAAGSFPGRDSMGLWVFADDLGPNGAAYESVVPTRGMDETVITTTQREALRSSLSAREPETDGHTELHQSALAAFRYQQENYMTGQLNAVVLISDGERGSTSSGKGRREDDVDESVPLDRLLKHLGSEQDPARPVAIITVETTSGPEDDDDALTEIAETTGGSHLHGARPADLRAALTDAVAAEAEVG